MRIFLVVERGEEAGAPSTAFLRNPEANIGRILRVREVRREGEEVHFWGNLAWEGEGEPRSILRGRYRQGEDLLTLHLEELGGSYDLQRLSKESTSAFFPRPSTAAPYRYRAPAPRGDGWQTGNLESVGLAREPIEALVRKLATTPIDSVEAPAINALLIARRGRLVVEEYFHGHSADRRHDVRSASKSLTAMLAGALEARVGLSLQTPVYTTMYGEALPQGLDPRARRMTLEHLLTMAPGLACDDWDPESPGGEDRMQSQGEEPDWYRYTLSLPMLHEPGEHAAYCSGGMNLAGGVLARAMGEPLTDLFHRYLAEPLQMTTYHTNLMPTGDAYAGGGLRLTARDFLKFGQLMLNDGVWNGERILPPGWAGRATTPHYTLGRRRPEGYGYAWWTFHYTLEDRQVDAYYAGGNSGSYIIVIPGLQMVIAFQGANYGQSIQHRTKYEDVPEFILPAAGAP